MIHVHIIISQTHRMPVTFVTTRAEHVMVHHMINVSHVPLAVSSTQANVSINVLMATMQMTSEYARFALKTAQHASDQAQTSASHARMTKFFIMAHVTKHVQNITSLTQTERARSASRRAARAGARARCGRHRDRRAGRASRYTP